MLLIAAEAMPPAVVVGDDDGKRNRTVCSPGCKQAGRQAAKQAGSEMEKQAHTHARIHACRPWYDVLRLLRALKAFMCGHG